MPSETTDTSDPADELRTIEADIDDLADRYLEHLVERSRAGDWTAVREMFVLVRRELVYPELTEEAFSPAVTAELNRMADEWILRYVAEHRPEALDDVKAALA